MKLIILALLLCFTISYKPERAIEYARKYCKNYNPAYINYNRLIGDSGNFVSQCLIAGGLSFEGCHGKDVRGSIPVIANLKACLSKLGWKNSIGYTKHFKDGYPFFQDNDFAHFATAVIGKNIKACDHVMSEGKTSCDDLYLANDNFQFFYP